jgi:hypothetical protein
MNDKLKKAAPIFYRKGARWISKQQKPHIKKYDISEMVRTCTACPYGLGFQI